MVKSTKSIRLLPRRSLTARLLGFGLAASLSLLGCSSGKEITEFTYTCETSPELSPSPGDGTVCGAGDPNLEGMEPQLPTEICQTLTATRFASDLSPPSEDTLDTALIQKALDSCRTAQLDANGAVVRPAGAVKLVASGGNNAFVSGQLRITGQTLWVDAGVTLYASRNPDVFQIPGNTCGAVGLNDSKACLNFIEVAGNRPAIVGDGIIDGQGGEPLIGHDYSWWQLSYALRDVDGSLGNPTLISLNSGTAGFVLYRITLHNSPKFHVKLTSILPAGTATCTRRGQGFTVWGVTVLTPSKWTNSLGVQLTPSYARNTDGIDPGSGSDAECGLMACNTISTGDDHIAFKGGHRVSDVTIAHNHFGTGHGMSIGSETYGPGIENIDIYDLTIDADSRPVGADAQAADFNGIRVKSDESRGGPVKNITYRDVCMRDMNNAILLSTAYNPLFAGTDFPEFGAMTFQNVHHVTCMGLRQPVVTLNGFNALRPAGPFSFDNVHIDNMGPRSASGQFSSIVLGPREVSFGDSLVALSQSATPEGGRGLTVTDGRDPLQAPAPKKCVFPTLPAPRPPAGWTW
ncbi:MAG: glycosyl hydrolase family 28 protein [Polyangiaceae bacterium]